MSVALESGTTFLDSPTRRIPRLILSRLLLFGGRSSGAGSFLGDLWALKGLMDDGGPAAWTKLVLPGPGPSPRCGHTTAAAGTQVTITDSRFWFVETL